MFSVLSFESEQLLLVFLVGLTGLFVIHSLGFCLSGNILISPSFVMDSFAGYRILS